MAQKAKRLDRRGPDWVGIGITVILLIVLGWLCVDYFNKAKARQDLIKALGRWDVTEVERILNHRRFSNQDLSVALNEFLESQYGAATPGRPLTPKLLTLLLDRGADPNFISQYRTTSIYYPLTNGDEKVTALLLSRGARFGKDKTDAESYLTAAVMNDNKNILLLVLDHGFPLGGKGEAGEKALEYAVVNNKPVSVGVLLDRGVSPNIKIQNESALCTALSMQYWDVARALVAHHADVNVTGANGRTPLSIVSKLNRKDMISLLKAHGAR